MFAVPGWSLGTEPPKRDRSTKKSSAKKRRNKNDSEHSADSFTASHPPSKKRKGETVDDSGPVQSRESHERNERNSGKLQNTSKGAPEAHDQRPTKRLKKTKDAKSDRRENQRIHEKVNDVKGEAAAKGSSLTARLTPLQSAMQKKLLGARFRHLNESLYTTASDDARKMFETNPTFFNEYHEGFRSQVASWPENPVDVFVTEIKERARIKTSLPRRQGPYVTASASEDDSVRSEPLPRTRGRCTVVDLGCGDASLARQVKKLGAKTGVEVLSFDLQSSNPLVKAADISALPLEADSVNVAIFCLALMGTNWIDFIEEAWRILRWKGELWIAEIKSRLGGMERRAKADKTQDKKKHTNLTEKRRKKHAEEEAATQNLIAEADGVEAKSEKTDVSAFITVLGKRGFVLENERGLDLSNKMFVRMKLVKATKPTKGKYKQDLPDNASFMARNKAWRNLLREDEEVDEASVLKPCLYKIR